MKEPITMATSYYKDHNSKQEHSKVTIHKYNLDN